MGSARVVLAVLAFLSSAAPSLRAAAGDEPLSAVESAGARRIELGERMYREGLLPSGERMTAVVEGDVELSGAQVICGTCHRRSGLGSSEGQEVVPAVAGALLYSPLRLPTSRPPLAPELRPAYTDATLKRAIREGIGAAGKPLSPFMPRYSLTDEQLELLIGYLKALSIGPAPGVDEHDLHLATIVGDAVPAETRKALLDVMQVYVEQKNTETRYESERAAHAPWHKDWMYKPYRKWVLHVWELHGPPEQWSEQLQAQYQAHPVFAVLGGVAPGSWRPIHEFCNRENLPCLFPTTDLPVIEENDFYTLYFSEGMALEGRTVAAHLTDDMPAVKSVVQVYRTADPRASAAAEALRKALSVPEGVKARNAPVPEGDPAPQSAFVEEDVVVLWLSPKDAAGFWKSLDTAPAPARIYLSTSLYGTALEDIPNSVRDRVYVVHDQELPEKLPTRLTRSTAWLRARRIYAPQQARVQADAYFALKLAGGALRDIRGFFSREYFIERIEHMVDNAVYTSVYPHVSLAPNQRFVSKGCYIAKLSPHGDAHLIPVTGWSASEAK